MNTPSILDPNDFKDIVETKEIPAEQLLEYLRTGWRPLLFFSRDVVATPGQYAASGPYGAGQPVASTVVISSPTILVGRSDLDRLRDIEQKHNGLAKSHDELHKKCASQTRALEEYEKSLEAAREAIESWRADQSHAREELQTQLHRNRKLEGDLAKVRTALGDIRWKEILGG